MNDTTVDIDSSLVSEVFDTVTRNLQQEQPHEISQYAYILSSHYQSGDVLDCTLKVTKLAAPSLTSVLETKILVES